MGVHGLWSLINPTGKPVSLESLENKVLAVDISLWLNHLVKGFRDKQGTPLPNAHLLGLFHRVCKLLFYRIKPVFVFDGGVPLLKKQTLAKRWLHKEKAQHKANNASEKLLMNFIKSHVVGKALAKNIEGKLYAVKSTSSPSKKERDLYELPPLENDSITDLGKPSTSQETSSDDSETEFLVQNYTNVDLHTVNFESKEFCAMPAEVQHDILTELRETRKQNSWSKLNEMPQDLGDFSSFQMKRLLKRSSLQQRLEAVQKELGDQNVLELDEIHGSRIQAQTQRIASDETKRFVLLTGLLERGNTKSSTEESSPSTSQDCKTAEKISEEVRENIWKDINADFIVVSSSDEDEVVHLEDSGRTLTKARDFMFENSGLTQKEILNIITSQRKMEDSNPLTSSGVRSQVSAAKNFESDSESSDFQEVPDVPVDVIFEKRWDISAKESTESKTEGSVDATKTDESSDKSAKQDTLLEIVIDPTKKNFDKDMFADIFQSPLPTGTDKSTGVLEVDSSIKEDTNGFSNVVEAKETRQVAPHAIEVMEVENEISSDSVEAKKTLQPNCSKLMNKETSAAMERNLIDREKSTEANKIGHEEASDMLKRESLDRDKLSQAGNFQDVQQGDSKMTEQEPDKHQESSQPESTELIHKENFNVHEQTSTSENVGHNSESRPSISREDLLETQAQLEKERSSLTEERGRQERVAVTITDQMYLEAQELLRLFGIPFIVAPMEAEAQCAFLDMISLTDGTITDDSDVWLFGGRKVYKNFFNQKRHLEFFQVSDIQESFKLDREKMAMLALLTGSDYTDGIESVGPVTALEILSEFAGSGLEPLKKFRDWWEKSQKQLKIPHETKVKQKLRNLTLHPGFPNETVVEAYLNPTVDESKEKFSWAMPKLDALREFARLKLGWTSKKSDEILIPVMKRYNQKVTQTRLDSFFKITLPDKNQKPKSKRVQRALKRVREDDGDGDEDKRDPPAVAQPKRMIAAKASGSSVSKTKAKPRLCDVNFQREVDNLKAQVNKLKAIEVFRKARQRDENKMKKSISTRPKGIMKKSADLSESSDDD